MPAKTAAVAARAIETRPRILVVDDEPHLVDLVGDVVGKGLSCIILNARSITEARQLLATEPIELLVTDVNLPDGDGTSLLATLRQKQPSASAIVITGAPSVDRAIMALRDGALDFLPKPFTAKILQERVKRALAQQAILAKKERRLERLRVAVKRLNEARRVVSKKVDLLCNDLITAYGELSKQLDGVRTQESFRKLLAEAKDLEQLLCHAMDWMLRQLGYSNVAVWLASEDSEFQLGAYMKYTTPGSPQLTDAMKSGIVPMVNRESFLHLSANEAKKVLTADELQHMSGQTVLAIACSYLGESLASVILFRDAASPFTDEDAAALKAISPIFATALASCVRGSEAHDQDDQAETDGGGATDSSYDNVEDDEPKDKDKNKPKKPKKDDADWWKRGEAPPF
ncbi:MAG TPA: response regulator [Tepidisphaeraceae bacterium]|nr:response regulator [Tepidisphaeraceae bacterium]